MFEEKGKKFNSPQYTLQSPFKYFFEFPYYHTYDHEDRL